MKKATFITSALTLAMPLVALAQNAPDFRYIDTVAGKGKYYLGFAVTILMILMTLFFLWTVFKLITTKKPEDLPNARKMVLNGLIGLFIAVGVWGIIRLAGTVTGVDVNNNRLTPNITCPPGTQPYADGCH